jgi:hypothetical protein
MHEHERKLIDAAVHFVDIGPGGDLFYEAYVELVQARKDYQIVAEARLGDPLKNDAGAFGANSRPTSIRAAFTIPDRGSLRGKMLKLFFEPVQVNWFFEQRTWTDFELAAHFERDVRTIGSCRLDLLRTGWIQQTTEVRFKPTDHDEKRPCIVWEMTELGRQKYEELYANG